MCMHVKFWHAVCVVCVKEIERDRDRNRDREERGHPSQHSLGSVCILSLASQCSPAQSLHQLETSFGVIWLRSTPVL